MIEHDFLSAFVQELEQETNKSHCLEGSEREAFISMLDIAKSKTEAYQKAITTIQSPEKKRQFEELYPSLIHLAKENCACLRIFDEDKTLLRVELEFLNILGGNGEDAVFGEILSTVFNLYRDFSLELTTTNHIILKFNVPLVDEVVVRTIFDKNER